MSTWRLVYQGIRHYWRGHLALALGVALAGSVLSGSLIIGDSVEASLEAMVVERLGPVESVLLMPAPAPQFFLGAGARLSVSMQL